MPDKSFREKNEPFAIRIRISEYEVELKGTRNEVMQTLESLSSIVSNVHKAFENVKPKTVATLTVKTEASKASVEASAQKYPKITAVENCEDAVVKILETDWGKWRPRTTDELLEAMRANDLEHSPHALEIALNELANKGLIRRWNTNAGFVYILAEGKSVSSGSEA
jgi:hypothetical protein